MPLLDVTNPDVIKFLVDCEEKCVRLRIKWNNANAEKIKEAATLHREEINSTTYDVLKSTMVAGMETLRRDHANSSSNRRRVPIRDGSQIPGVEQLKKGNSIVDVTLGDPEEDPRLNRSDTDTSLDPIMRVVDPAQKSIIYKDVPDFGRAVYLKNRSRMQPEEKYYFPECSSLDYGWRINESELSHNRPACGRVWRYTRDAKSRSGPHPDPAYYKDFNINTVVKCAK